MISLRTNGRVDGESASSVLQCAKGEIIYEQGAPAKYWFEVVSGVVRTCHFHADGHRQLTGFFYPGDVFGFDQTSYRETAEAVNELSVRRHGRAANQAEMEPEVQEYALRKALRSAQECIFLLGHRTASERVAAFLLAMVARLPAEEKLPVPMSRGDIADHLGLTMHTVSRTISDLARRKLIATDTPHQIRIVDAEGLRAHATATPGPLWDWQQPAVDEDDHNLQVA